MNKNSKALIFAHYDKTGSLRQDIVDFISLANDVFEKIIFVSTNLQLDAAKKLPSNIDIIIRENIGYDFYSYRAGFLSLINQTYDLVYLINSSIVILDPYKFINKIVNVEFDSNTMYGVTKTTILAPDTIQSYCLILPTNIYKDFRIINWWVSMPVLTDKKQIIRKLEIGFSELVKSSGFDVCGIFEFHDNYNPPWIYPKEVYQDVGIVKASVVTHNAYNADTSFLYDAALDSRINYILYQVTQ